MKSKFPKSKPAPIMTHDEFLARQTPELRTSLSRLRATIQECLPKAKECISYQMPAFCLDGKPVVAYGAGKSHCSIYPLSGRVVAALAEDLARYDTSKGTIRFPPSQTFPKGLIKKIIAFRIKENAQKLAAKRATKSSARSSPRSDSARPGNSAPRVKSGASPATKKQ